MQVTALLVWTVFIQAAALRKVDPVFVAFKMAAASDAPPSKVQATQWALMTKALGGPPGAPPPRSTATGSQAAAADAAGAGAGMAAMAAAAVSQALTVAKQKAEGVGVLEEDQDYPIEDADAPHLVAAGAHPPGSIAAIIAAATGGKGGAGRGGGGRGLTGAEARHRRLMLQMEARLRTVEDIVMITVKAPLALPPMAVGLFLTHYYQKAVTADPQNHQLGGPDAFVAGGFLRALAELQLPVGADISLKAHHSAIKALACWSGRRSPSQNALWVHHSSMWALPDVAKAEGLYQYSFEGTVSIPASDDQTTQCNLALDAALATGDAPPHQIQDLFFTEDLGAPIHSGIKGKPVDKLILAVLCGIGATRQPKPGRGGAARAVKGKGKGK